MSDVLGRVLLAGIVAFLCYRRWCVIQFEQGKRATKPEDLWS